MQHTRIWRRTRAASLPRHAAGLDRVNPLAAGRFDASWARRRARAGTRRAAAPRALPGAPTSAPANWADFEDFGLWRLGRRPTSITSAAFAGDGLGDCGPTTPRRKPDPLADAAAGISSHMNATTPAPLGRGNARHFRGRGRPTRATRVAVDRPVASQAAPAPAASACRAERASPFRGRVPRPAQSREVC